MIAQGQGTFQEGPSGLSTKERDDAYHAVIHLGGNWRIILCKDRLQWIIQHAKKVGTESRWCAVSYVTSQTALIRLWTAKTGLSANALIQKLERRKGSAL